MYSVCRCGHPVTEINTIAVQTLKDKQQSDTKRFRMPSRSYRAGGQERDQCKNS